MAINFADTLGIVRKLRQTYTREEARLGLESPHPQLGGKSALVVIQTGGIDDVYSVFDRRDSAAVIWRGT
jgi:hypothetical protein